MLERALHLHHTQTLLMETREDGKASSIISACPRHMTVLCLAPVELETLSVNLRETLYKKHTASIVQVNCENERRRKT